MFFFFCLNLKGFLTWGNDSVSSANSTNLIVFSFSVLQKIQNNSEIFLPSLSSFLNVFLDVLICSQWLADNFPLDKFPKIQLTPGQVPERSSPTQHRNPLTDIYTQMLAVYSQYKYTYKKMYMPQPCARRSHRNPPNDVHSPHVAPPDKFPKRQVPWPGTCLGGSCPGGTCLLAVYNFTSRPCSINPCRLERS